MPSGCAEVRAPLSSAGLPIFILAASWFLHSPATFCTAMWPGLSATRWPCGRSVWGGMAWHAAVLRRLALKSSLGSLPSLPRDNRSAHSDSVGLCFARLPCQVARRVSGPPDSPSSVATMQPGCAANCQHACTGHRTPCGIVKLVCGAVACYDMQGLPRHRRGHAGGAARGVRDIAERDGRPRVSVAQLRLPGSSHRRSRQLPVRHAAGGDSGAQRSRCGAGLRAGGQGEEAAGGAGRAAEQAVLQRMAYRGPLHRRPHRRCRCPAGCWGVKRKSSLCAIGPSHHGWPFFALPRPAALLPRPPSQPAGRRSCPCCSGGASPSC